MSEETTILSVEGRVAAAEAAPDVQMEKFLMFASDGLLFGVKVAYVVEILTNHAVTHLPMVPEYVGGIINLRGQIIPIIDFRLRMGKTPREDCCIMVLSVAGNQMGVTVDAVAQLVDIPAQNILSVPAHNAQKLISGMCALQDGRTMLILDCALLLEN